MAYCNIIEFMVKLNCFKIGIIIIIKVYKIKSKKLYSKCSIWIFTNENETKNYKFLIKIFNQVNEKQWWIVVIIQVYKYR